MGDQSHLMLMHQAFVQVEAMRQRSDQPNAWHVLPGSSLHEDDEQSHPLNVSHTVQRLLLACIDHLHAVRSLMSDADLGGANVAHIYAPYSLSRAAIEASATGLWVLKPATRGDRVSRCLALALQDAWDASRVLAGHGQRDEVMERRRALIDKVTERTGHRPPRSFPKPHELVKAADTEEALGPSTAYAIASGMTHARLWTLQTLSKLTVVAETAGVVTHTAEIELRHFAAIYGVALETSSRLIRLYEQRSTPDHCVTR